MSKFNDHMFSFKDAYAFEKLDKKPLKQRLHHELIYQLEDLERHWIKFGQLKETRSLQEEFQYQHHLERVNFRLEEIKRFLEESKGPRIIKFVCSEIYDLLMEQQIIETSLSQEIIEQVSIILTVMNSFFQPGISKLQLITVEEVAQLLKERTEGLLRRYAGKNREESLDSLSKLGPWRGDGAN